MAQKVVLPGTGEAILTDQLTASETGHVQYVKLMDGTEDGTQTGLINSDGVAASLDRPNNQLNIFQPILSQLQRIVAAIKLPDFIQPIVSGKALRVFFDANSALPTIPTVAAVTTVTTVTTTGAVTNLTNFNTIDSREVIWNGWKQNYYNGIRARIS